MSTAVAGQPLPTWHLDTVDDARMKLLALLLADPNPLHFDRQACIRLGIADREVNQGPGSMALLMNLVLAAFPGGHIEQFHARLLGNVLAGDAVAVTGEVHAREAVGDGERATCSLALNVVGSGVVMTAEAIVRTGHSQSPA